MCLYALISHRPIVQVEGASHTPAQRRTSAGWATQRTDPSTSDPQFRMSQVALHALLLAVALCCAPLAVARKYLPTTLTPALVAFPAVKAHAQQSHTRIHGGHQQDTLAFTEPKPPSVLEVTPYQSVTLVCEAAIVEGPAPLVHWFHNGRPLSFAALDNSSDPGDWLTTDPGAQVVSSTTRSVLPLDCITAAHTDSYVCVAETAALRIETTTRVLLAHSGRGFGTRGKLEMAWQRECQLQAEDLPSAMSVPRIVMWSKNLLQHTAQTARLYCRSTGTPRPTVTWHFTPARRNRTAVGQGKHLIANDESKYQVLPLGDLLIKELSVRRDMGYYVCRVENHAGSDHATSFLYPLRTRH